MRREFATEWAKCQGQQLADGERRSLSVTLRPEHYPYWSQGRLKKVAGITFVVEGSTEVSIELFNVATGGTAISTPARDPARGQLLVGVLDAASLPATPLTTLKFFFPNKPLTDLWLGVEWSV